MSFTQEKETNITLRCNGCEKRCKLDVYYGPLYDITNNYLEYYTPIIGTKKITEYKDETGTLVQAYKNPIILFTSNIKTNQQIRQYMLNLAQEITRLCDNYKQR